MEAGQPYEQFWRLTLREINVILDGALSRLKREHNERAWLAWHTAHLTVYAPQKSSQFQKLETLLWRDKPSERRMTPEQFEAATRSWLAGATKRKSNG